jgi:hypothetical protein
MVKPPYLDEPPDEGAMVTAAAYVPAGAPLRMEKVTVCADVIVAPLATEPDKSASL